MKILIPKFAEYQHYGKRMPPWIKLHKKLLDDHKFWSLKAEQQILLVALWLLASENPLEEECGVVQMTRHELHWRLRDANMKGLDALKSQGFIDIQETEEDASKGATPHASKALARRYPQREREGETEAERETEADMSPSDSLDLAAEGAQSPERQVFEHWKSATKKPGAQWTSARQRILSTRLGEDPEGIEGLKRAVDGAVGDPFFNGSETGKPFLDFENLFKHGGRDRIEKLQGCYQAQRSGKKPIPQKAQQRSDGLRAMVAGGLRSGEAK